MTVAVTYEDRIALIRKIAQRKKKLERVKTQTRSISKNLPKPERKKQIESNDNINAYTDASKYAKQYYGEVFYETTRYDNEWD